MRDDLKAAFRSFRSSMSVTMVALVVLTLGIGASTAIFSVVQQPANRSPVGDKTGVIHAPVREC
jgi:hypothetical protein